MLARFLSRLGRTGGGGGGGGGRIVVWDLTTAHKFSALQLERLFPGGRPQNKRPKKRRRRTRTEQSIPLFASGASFPLPSPFSYHRPLLSSRTSPLLSLLHERKANGFMIREGHTTPARERVLHPQFSFYGMKRFAS